METQEEWQESLPPHRHSEKMHWTGGYVFVVLVSLTASRTAGALSVDTDGNGTKTSNVTDGGFVPVVFTKVSQIIAREGSCALIDCNVTGDPFPRVQWFNSHGDRLDTETSGETDCAVTLNLVSCSLCHQRCQSLNYNFISWEGVRFVIYYEQGSWKNKDWTWNLLVVGKGLMNLHSTDYYMKVCFTQT